MSYAYNELGNAQRFEDDTKTKGKYAWTRATDWLRYKSGKWVRDHEGGAVRLMILIGESIAAEGSKEAESWSRKSGSNSVIKGSLALASKLRGIAKSIHQFDNHKELFNCTNGTYELNTGIFREHRPEDCLTKSSNITYDVNATCPKFEKFISDVMAGKEEMRLFLQRAVGYSISAYTNETAVFIPYGPPGTGKSQFLLVMRGILGDYAASAEADIFLAKHGDAGQPFEWAGREGIHALFSSETREGKRLDQAKVKMLTGGDPVRACYKGKEAYEFIPQWKIWFATNDKPVVTAEDAAMWDRLKLIPFDVRFRNEPGQIKDIADMLLREEAAGILNWCLRGYAMWQEHGLNYPKEVTDAVAEWRDDEDYLQRFLEEFTVSTEDRMEFVKKSDLFKRFVDWAKDSKEGRGLTDKAFSTNMQRKGYECKGVKKGLKNDRCWLGIRLVDPLERFSETTMSDADVDDLRTASEAVRVSKPN